ncbi:nuclear transport factor 2 family protein [Occallatibacter savannae]|uniref:nuclear transport factor 2 family protein n=1 Tax=Occallatibacter savannae TaxID=1002691 RepID=UPI000D6964F7|nr:nuclear transport factor 2 family protein [Occallatibacter savannae]
MKLWSAIFAALLLAPSGAHAAGDRSSDVQVREALTIFLTAFDNLDWPAFRACFGPDPTMFHPAAPNTRRVETEEQFDKAWAGVFDRIRKSSGRSRPPFMQLEPKDLRIEFPSEDVAIVTFHILNPGEIDRRTILFKRYGSAWKTVHIHASNLRTDAEHP